MSKILRFAMPLLLFAGLGYFLLKGLAKVRGEFSLTVLAYNLKRVFNLVGVPRLVAALA